MSRNTFFRRHLSFDDAVALAETQDRSDHDRPTETFDRRYIWQGGNYGEVMAMAKGDGYSVSLPSVDAIVKRIDTQLAKTLTPNFDWQYSVAGAEVDMGRFIGGEPENMISTIPLKVMRTGRIISLYVPGNVDAGITPEQLIARGAACVALAHAFAQLQHPMEIWSSLVNTDGNNRAAVLVNIQRATAPLDNGRVMFALAHPGFPRQMGFAIKEAVGKLDEFRLKNGRPMADDMGWKEHGGYGSGERDILPEDVLGDGAHTIILPELTKYDARNFENQEWVQGWILKQIERIQAN